MQPETRFKLKVQKRLSEIPGLYHVKIQQVALRGVPDILACFRGWFIALELKVPPNKIKAGSLQELNLKWIEEAGGYAREVTPNNLDEVIEEILCLDTFRDYLKRKRT